MTRPVLQKARPNLPEQDIPDLLTDFAAILRSGVLTMGPFLERFESLFAAHAGVQHAVGMNSGTAPMEIAMRYWEVSGGEVVVTTNTFMATVHAAQLAGARPVLADIDPDCLSSMLAQIEPLVNGQTRAIIVVHVGGQIVPDISELADFCAARGLPLLEDAAHAHGSAREGRRAGALGTAGSFSFFPTKVMTTGEGGMLTTDDDDLAAFARSYRCHGIGEGRLLQRLGANFRMPELSAALGVRQLSRLDDTLAERRSIAQWYDEALDSMAQSPRHTPSPGPDEANAYYKYAVTLPPGAERELATRQMAAAGVPTGSLYWPPCHLQPSAQRSLGPQICPVAEDVLNRVITLPLYNGMTRDDVEFVTQQLQAAIFA
jgi:perosamine synthetase